MSLVAHNVRYYGPDIEALASKLDIEPATLHAVAAVEVGEIAYPAPGLPVIRFEVHCYLDRVGSSELVQLRDAPSRWHNDAHWYRESVSEPWQRVHTGSQASEWGALCQAGSENIVALSCASYGVGQLMGWHHATIGIKSAERMLGRAIGGGIGAQLDQWGAYLANDHDGAMVDALQVHDWEAFVRLYNGPGQVDYYTSALVARYEEAVEVLANGVPPDHDLDTWSGRQQALTDLGYDPGPVDGVNGAMTTAAIKAFQRDHGLNPDGWWGRYTEEHVTRALSTL